MGTWNLARRKREHIIGTSRGVAKCRAIAAVEDSKKFDETKLTEIRVLLATSAREANGHNSKSQQNVKRKKTRLKMRKLRSSKFKSNNKNNMLVPLRNPS